MSENKKFRIQNGVDIRGEMSFGDQVVVDDSLNITGKTITADTFEGDGSNLTGVVKPSDLNTLIDSDYIQERVVLDGVGIDSADAQLLIDVEKNRAQSAEQVNATAIQSNTNAIDAERQARIEGDQLAVNGRTVQFATLEAMISAEETRATVAEAGLSQDIVDSTSLSISGDSDLQSQINSIKAGDTEFTGDLIPDQDNVHSLGSETKMWKDVYVGPGSLYINGQKVIEDNSGTITVNADPGQNLSLNTSGGGAIDLNSGDESVQIRSDLIISSSKTISTAGGAATKFGGDVDMQSNQIGNLGVPLQSTDAATKQYVDSVIAVPHTGTKTFDDDVVIGGTLTVKGSTTTIESETLSVADNMVDLNSNMTSGTPTENAGIRVLRGDESPKSFLWKESQGTWSAEGPITATTYYGDGSNLVGIDVYTDADVTALVDSDYVQSRVVIPESGTDSAEVISLIPTQIEAYNSANNVHFSGTNVGIGTSSPVSALQVNVGTNLNLGVNEDSSTVRLSAYNDAASASVPMTVNSSSTRFDISGIERMRIDANGNVGIGTSSITTFGGYQTLHFKNTAGDAIQLNETDGGVINQIICTDGGGGQVLIGARSNHPTLFTTNDTERMRIDGSGNLLVGKTSSGIANSGFEVGQSGQINVTQASAVVGRFNRKTSDGSILELQKDGSTVGSIGTGYGVIDIKGGSAGLLMGNTAVLPVDGSGTLTSGAYDIGAGSFSFKDLYLSGFINVGNDIRMKQTNPRIDYDNGSSGALRFFSTSANSERMRLTSDGNLLVGKDVNDLTTDGVVLRGSGELFVTRANDVAAFNRRSSDGDIVTFRRDGTTVGSIGAYQGTTYIQGNSVSSGFLFGNSNIYPWDAGAINDAGIDLGSSSNRFKDLYLSGNVYIGGNTAIHSGNLSELGILHKAGGGAYYRPDNWIDFGSDSEFGLYWGSGTAYGWHLFPQDKAYMTLRSGTSSHSGIVVKCNDDTPRGYFYADHNNNVGILTADANWALRIDNDKDAHLEGDLYVNNGQGIKLRTSAGAERGSISAHEGTSNLRISTSNGESIAFYDGTTENMRIDGGGNVSVTGTITESSSITYKENVDPITNALELVTQLVGVTYDRKDGSAKDRAGLIAEQVNEVLPNVVKKNEEGGAEAIAYTNLIAYLIESVKELKSEIDELRGK